MSDQTVGNILLRHGIPPAPKRKQRTRWRDFIRAHMDVLVGTDFFTVEVFTLKGLVTYYVLFFIQLESRRVCLAGITPHPDQEWMEQQARNVTMGEWGFLAHSKYLLHDRDGKFCSGFRELIEAGNVKTLQLPTRSPNLNAYAERWVRSVKEECLSKLILFGENSLRRDLTQYMEHYHTEGIIRAKPITCCSRYREDFRTRPSVMIEEQGGRALAVRCDVARAEDVKAALTKTAEAFSRLDFAFNNAGIEPKKPAPTADYDLEEWDQIINIDLRGVFLCMKFQIPLMLKHGGRRNREHLLGCRSHRVSRGAQHTRRRNTP
jgi:hypothetical protein